MTGSRTTQRAPMPLLRRSLSLAALLIAIIAASITTSAAARPRSEVPVRNVAVKAVSTPGIIRLIPATSAGRAPGPTAPNPAVPVTTVRSTVARSGFVSRSGSQLLLAGTRFRFAGTNEYYLGLDDNLRDSSGNPTKPTKAAVDDALQSAAGTGATVVRSHTLGISVGCAACLEPRPGVFNDSALSSADYAIFRAGRLGLKLLIPLTDQWRWYHGGESTFTGWAGYPNDPDPSVDAATNSVQRAAESHFYTDPAVISSFRQYVGHLLNHVNPYTGLAYKNDPTVLAWETGNEIWTAPPSWTESLAAYIKHTVGARQLVVDGSAADGMSVANAAVDAADVDIVGGHFYPIDVPTMHRDASVAAAHGKAYVVGEFDWTDAAATRSLLAAVQADPNISGDLYWTMMPHLANGDREPHEEGFAMYSPASTTAMAGVLAMLTANGRWMATVR